MIDAEYEYRVMRLMLDRDMSHRAAKIVVDAAMYGIGCTEGRVRERIEHMKGRNAVPKN